MWWHLAIEILLESKEWGQLEVAEMRLRLATFISDWFDPAQRLDTVNNVRFTARLRTYSAKSGVSAGELMELLLPVARAIYEKSAAAIRDEDQASTLVVEPEPEPQPVLGSVKKPRSKKSKVGAV